jgi:hypothetical protein
MPCKWLFVQRLAMLLALLLVLAYLPGCGQSDQRSKLRSVSLSEFKAELKKRGIWWGGADYKFEDVGRGTLSTAIEHGLMPDHKVLDIGAGSLRVGWWLLHYIEPSNYYVIEPVQDRIHTAIEILGADDINVYYNMDFEFPSTRFDFVIARSIWTHASKSMISKMLSEFAENSNPNAKFLTSVKLAQSESQDYKGDEWVGRVEKTGRPAVVWHSLEWMQQESAKNGLTLEVLENLTGQTWVLIARQSD